MNHSKDISKYLLSLIIIFSVVLRFTWLDRFPPSLYTDEINQGYNAYSILLTARDEHGVLLPVSLRSFGDWKPPLPTYLMIPFIYFFGLSEFSVRLPSVLLGIGTIITSFYLIKEVFKKEPYNTHLALLVSFFLTISPWHILQSRSAMLVMVALFFFELGIFLFIKSDKSPKLLIVSAVSFALSIYSYYGMRIIVPITLVFLLFYFRKNIKRNFRELLMSAVVALLILTPLFVAYISEPDVVYGRVKTVSVFYDQGVELRQWELIAQDGVTFSSPFISRLFHNNWYMFGRDIIRRFLSHFDGKYLLLTGDQSPPFQIPSMGILYLVDVVFGFYGLLLLFKEKYSLRMLIIFWMSVSFIPAALTFMTPSSNRSFNSIVPLIILIAIGIAKVAKRKNLFLATSITTLYAINFAYFLYQYLIILPRQHSDWWSYGWKETVEYTRNIENKYDNIVIPDINGMPYIYFLFYNQYDPGRFQKEAVRTYVTDRFGFEHVESFNKYFFPMEFDWRYIKENLQANTVYIVPYNQAGEDNNYIKAIFYPNGKIAYKIFAYE